MSGRVRVVDNLDEACEHIKALYEYCRANRLEVGYYNEAPWATCHQCGIELEHIVLGREGVEVEREMPESEVPF